MIVYLGSCKCRKHFTRRKRKKKLQCSYCKSPIEWKKIEGSNYGRKI